jgi:hypothetical protein
MCGFNSTDRDYNQIRPTSFSVDPTIPVFTKIQSVASNTKPAEKHTDLRAVRSFCAHTARTTFTVTMQLKTDAKGENSKMVKSRQLWKLLK